MRTYRYKNWVGIGKGRESRDQIANISWIIKQGNTRKMSTFASLTILKPLTVWITTNWKILQEMGIPDHMTCLLRNLYAGQEATVRMKLEPIIQSEVNQKDKEQYSILMNIYGI